MSSLDVLEVWGWKVAARRAHAWHKLRPRAAQLSRRTILRYGNPWEWAIYSRSAWLTL